MIEGVRWFAGKDCIGIVQIVQDHQKELYRQTGEADFKYYIGLGLGIDAREDARNIAEYGTPFDTNAGNALFSVQSPLKTNWK